MSCVIRGTGSYLPERVLTNAYFEERLATSDEWIVSRTGMRERRMLAEDEATSDLAARAGAAALADAGVRAEDLDLIICATFSPDMVTPSAANLVQAKLCRNRAIPSFDVNAACSGFVYGLEVARSLVEGGQFPRVLLIGCEALTRWTNYEDRGTAILFGDGAGAVVLERVEGSRGVLATTLRSAGEYADLICIPGGGSRRPPSPYVLAQRQALIKMDGRQVFKLAVQSMEEVAKDTLSRVGWSLSDVDHLLVHQANQRIIDAVADRMQVPASKLPTCIERTGNISAATIPVLMDQCRHEGRFKPGDRLLLVAFGGGLTWGAAAVEWTQAARG